MNKINYYHSLIFFNLCILLSAFEFLRDNSLLILCLFLILSLGISHGALDHIKGKKLLKLLNYKSTSTFYILYILIGVTIILLWLLFSKILLLIFLIVASYHFGKEDSEFINGKSNLNLIYFFKGSLVITAPLLLHKTETLKIFNNLNFNISESLFISNEFLYLFIAISLFTNIIISFNKTDKNKINIGSVGGMTRLSTGYTFLNIQDHSKYITNNIEKIQNTKTYCIGKKYEFLDNIFLNVLKNNPEKMPKIFLNMFKASSKTVIKFLSNKSNFFEDLEIILKMPKWIFIKNIF